MKREQSLLEVSMMLGDAIDKLNALSAYKDPYAHLKDAYARGETIQIIGAGGKWIDYTWGCPDWTMGVDGYRIKPKTKTLYKWAYLTDVTKVWKTTGQYHESEEDVRQDLRWITEFKRLDYTAIEVDA